MACNTSTNSSGCSAANHDPRIFLWWCGQLADLLPRWLHRSALTAADAMVIATVGAIGEVDTIAIALRPHGKETVLGRLDLAGPSEAELPRAPVLSSH